MSQLKPTILALISGILFSFTWNSFFPAIPLFIVFVPLLILFENNQLPLVRVYNLLFLAFMLYQIGTVWWLSKSSVFGFFVIIVSNSMYLALSMLLIYRIRQLFGLALAWFSFICIWLAFEYIHFSWELSWPFMNLGNWLGQMHQWVQWYEYTGVLGGTLWILLINLSIYLIIRNIRNWKSLKMACLIGFTSILIIVPILVSLNIYNNYHDSKESLTFKVIQPNIDPYKEKYKPELYNKQINNQLTMAEESGSGSIDCYLFPESSFPIYLNEDSCEKHPIIKKTESGLLKNQGVLVMGGLYSFRVVDGDSVFYNAAFSISSGVKLKTRHKSKLVIGVEKMPFQDYFAFLKKLNLDFGGFTNSLAIDKEPVVFDIPDKSCSIAPIICYESVYGQYVSEFVKKGATCITVITNDAWWGKSPGYLQHLMHSKLRAIENRRNVVRAANTGFSCIINDRGDIVSQIPPFIKNTLTGQVNQNTELSFYTQHGDFIGVIAFWCSIAMIFMILAKFFIKKYR